MTSIESRSRESGVKLSRPGFPFPRSVESARTLIGFVLVIVSFAVMVGCGGGSGSSSTTSTSNPTIALSPTSLTFTTGVGVASTPQSVTVTNSGTAAAALSGIAFSGTNASEFSQTTACTTTLAASVTCTIAVTFTPTTAGAASATLTVTDNSGGTSGSTQTVTLSGTGTSLSVAPTTLSFPGVAVGTTSAAQSVTVSNTGTAAAAISTPTITGNFAISANTCGTSLAANSSCTISVTFTPQGSGPWTGTLTIGGVSQSVSLTGTNTVSNTVPVSVNFGPAGQSAGFLNIPFVTVTVCQPGTQTCVSVPYVEVDTMSTGLRVLSSALSGVNLTPLNDGGGNNLNECVEYGDGSFNWGPLVLASVQVGGETASQVPAAAGGSANSGIPIQIITTDPVPTAVKNAGQCIASTSTPDDDTVATFGANGILGLMGEPQDCAFAGVNYCDNSTDAQLLANNGELFYWYCNTAGGCGQEVVPLTQQLWNPVAAFSSSDTNGVLLTLQSIPATGAATATGTLTFGIGTESNNALPGGATVYEQDTNGYLPEITFNGLNYFDVNSQGQITNPTFLDTGSTALVVSDSTTLTSATGVSITLCSDGSYCPASTLSLNLTLFGETSASALGTANLSIANEQSLLTGNPSFAAFDDIAFPSGTNPSTDYFDLGLPFWFGKTIAVGIAGATTGSPNDPNGYWAF